MNKTIAAQIAEVAVATTYDKLPAEAVTKAKMLTLDVLASMVGTRNVISSEIAREISEELAGPAEATIVGSKDKVAASSAMAWISWTTTTSPTPTPPPPPSPWAWP